MLNAFMRGQTRLSLLLLMSCLAPSTFAEDTSSASEPRTYRNTLTRLENPAPLLADHPKFVQPVKEVTRFEAPLLVDDEGADLSVRAWRFSYNARGIIEMPNRLRSDQTAVIMVHPWGIDDGQGWTTPEPAGVCDFCTLDKNHLAAEHTRTVIDPFIKQMRPHVAHVMFSLRGGRDGIRERVYRTVTGTPSDEVRAQARKEMDEALNSFEYRGEPLPETLELSSDTPVIDYFKQFPGLDASAKYNNVGFWDLPTPVTSDITMAADDVVIIDQDGYPPLRDFLKKEGVRHILLTGYATDMCFCKTTAGYENLSKDFNVFLVGDATLATFPANSTPHMRRTPTSRLPLSTSW
ncbi:MAG: isochorismatase family protein [Planctomycetaceae bacterium]